MNRCLHIKQSPHDHRHMHVASPLPPPPPPPPPPTHTHTHTHTLKARASYNRRTLGSKLQTCYCTVASPTCEQYKNKGRHSTERKFLLAMVLPGTTVLTVSCTFTQHRAEFIHTQHRAEYHRAEYIHTQHRAEYIHTQHRVSMSVNFFDFYPALLSPSGGIVNFTDFYPALLKSLGCFYFQHMHSSQWKVVTLNLQNLQCQL